MNAAPGKVVSGTYARRLSLSSGRFAVIETMDADGGLGFRLVPWSPTLERHRGRQVSGVMRETGGIDWSFGRKRGLER